jgi:hypothetical protein
MRRQFYSSVQGPPGSKRRQLARQVGAYCVLTNNFPLSSRWVVSSNLFSPGRCSVLGVSSSCPSTAATTWYSFPRGATATTTADSPPGGGGLNDVFPPWRKSSIRVCPATFLAAGGGGGATVAKQEAAPRRLSSESTTSAPQRGTCQALTSRMRRRQVSFPRDVLTPSRQMTPALSRRACWALAVPDATSSSSIDREVPSVFHPMPFRFSFDPPSDPASVSAFIKAYPNLPGYHMWSTWDRMTPVSTHGPPGSEEEDEPDSGWDFLRAPCS